MFSRNGTGPIQPPTIDSPKRGSSGTPHQSSYRSIDSPHRGRVFPRRGGSGIRTVLPVQHHRAMLAPSTARGR